MRLRYGWGERARTVVTLSMDEQRLILLHE